MSSRPPLWSLLVVACLSGPVAADTVTLTNGSQIHGKVLSENETTVRLKTGGGVMELARDKVASIERNEKGTGQPQPARRPSPKPDEPEQPEEPEEPEEEQAPTAPETADAEALRAELEALGPSEDERLAAIALSDEQEQELGTLIARLGRTGNRGGNPRQIREGARDRIIQQLGLKALPRLDKELRGGNYWRARLGSAALAQIVRSDSQQGRWLAYHLDTPAALIKLLERGGEEALSPALRLEANLALEAVTGQSQDYPAADSTEPSAAERQAQVRWRTWWRSAKRDWQREQRAAEKRRKELRELLGD